MPEQLLGHPAAAPERGDQEPEAGHEETVDLTAVRDLKKSRTDVEALGFTDEQLRRLQDASTRAGEQSRKRTAEQADRQDAGAASRARENDQQPYHSIQPDSFHRPEPGR
ncbi:hypothetical protein [Streptomyces niveus]|uniref:hypothetical protein n=1 Tax=Streptomyces niveus TaxID=193462 RepID=UPI0036BEC0B4